MKHRFENGSRSRTQVAAAALLTGLALVSGAATARQYSYHAPHPKLTPYQLVADDGRCLQAESPTLTVNSVLTATSLLDLTSAPALAPCSDSAAQKFYVLQRQGLSDFVPQVHAARPDVAGTGSNARIVLAADLDGSPAGGYSYLLLHPSQGIRITPAAVLNLPFTPFTWRISRTNAAQEWKPVQMESGWLPLAGPGTREMRFGVEGSWIEKDPPLKLPDNGETMAFVCDEGTFGGDPKMDALKRCDMRLSPPDDTPLQLSIQAGGKCMARIGETVSTAPCSSAAPVAIPPNALWNLRPTQYPSTPSTPAN